MKAIEIRSLLINKNVEIQIPVDVIDVFNIWKHLRKDHNLSFEEVFYVGYILSNPIVRDKYKQFKKVNRM